MISVLPVGPLQANCYLVVDEATGEAVLVDPGAEGDRLVAAVEASGARLTGIWLTHGHFDHVGGVARVHAEWPVPIHLHPADAPLYERAERSAAGYGLVVEAPPPFDVLLADGDQVEVGALRFEVMHTPGHAPGHVIFHGHGVALGGDCLFAGSVGRTDLPLGDPRQLASSLLRIAALPPSTRVLPGHGPETTIARELRSNPFLSGDVRVLTG